MTEHQPAPPILVRRQPREEARAAGARGFCIRYPAVTRAMAGSAAVVAVPVGRFAAPRATWSQAVHELPVDYPYPEPAWSPYIAGALIGVLALLTLTISRKPVGASSAYADLAGLVGRGVAPKHVASLDYYRDHRPAVSWTLVFVLAAIGGAFLAAWTGGELTGRYLQDLWVARFGEDSHALRTLFAFAGGSVMVYGARMAGGCTSGHGISGTLQLALSSWIAVICFFVGGAATALWIYRL